MEPRLYKESRASVTTFLRACPTSRQENSRHKWYEEITSLSPYVYYVVS